jgi:hypothetical protein
MERGEDFNVNSSSERTIKMRIEISKKSDGSFLADCSEISGSPPIGSGPEKFSAIGHLIFRLSKEVEGLSGLTYLQKYFGLDIKFNENTEPESQEEIHSQLWDNDVTYVVGCYEEGEI